MLSSLSWKRKIIEKIGPPRRIVSDNATAFMAASVQWFMEKHSIDRKSVLPYAKMENGRAERMVGIMKHAIKRSVVQNGDDWARAMPKVIPIYRRRDRVDVSLPFRLIYGIEPKMMVSDTVALLG